MIAKLSLARRTVLRGVGTTIALPFLDAMLPAMTRALPSPTRFGALYVPNGILLRDFVPAEEGPRFQMPPILQALAPHEQHVTIVSGLSNRQADSLAEGGGPHSRSNACWLSGVRARRSESDLRVGITLDQLIAKEVGSQTALPSLELALEPNFAVGNCEAGYSCVYINTFSWRTPTMPLPMETNPRVVFERLFGDGQTGLARAAQTKLNHSILDSVMNDWSRLRRTVGPSDERTLNEYLDAIRDVERRLQTAETKSSDDINPETRPLGIPARFEDHARVMMDLMYLAYRTDMTRVSTFQLGRELSVRSFPEIGVPEAHHDISHHGNAPDKMVKKAKIDTLHTSLVSHLVERMASTADGDGSLLDHSLLLFGASMGDGNLHSAHNLPVALIGRASGRLQSGRHLKVKLDTPFMNLGLSLVHKFGVQVDAVGDSTGPLADI